MSQPNLKYEPQRERAYAIAQARAELLRLSEERGVGPVTNFDDLLGHPPEDDEGNNEADEFLRLRQDRRGEELELWEKKINNGSGC